MSPTAMITTPKPLDHLSRAKIDTIANDKNIKSKIYTTIILISTNLDYIFYIKKPPSTRTMTPINELGLHQF